MRAYEIHEFGIDKLARVELGEPRPGAREVLVKINAVSLNYRDLMVVSGTYNPRMKLPAVPVSDAAGEIAEIGEGVTRWKVGDRVMPIMVQGWLDGPSNDENRRTAIGAGSQWNGVLKEFAVFSEQGLVAAPHHLSFEEASTLPCAGLTAWNALSVSGDLRAGETVLTLGTGGVAIFAVQLAKLFGARVISTSSSDEKLARLSKLGSDDVINYRNREDWDRAVLELTGKLGVDHVVEVGGAGTLQRSLSAVRVGGHIALIGSLTGAADFDPVKVFMRSVRLQGIFTGSRQMLIDLSRAVEVNKVVPVVDRVFGFDEVVDALRYLESGQHFGKIVIKVH